MTTHRHHVIVRLTHWVNALALVIMTGSGLRICNASPGFARKGETFPLNPWEGMAAPSWLTFGGWLGGARHGHFAVMWVLVANAALYLGFIFLHDEWRDPCPASEHPRRCVGDDLAHCRCARLGACKSQRPREA